MAASPRFAASSFPPDSLWICSAAVLPTPVFSLRRGNIQEDEPLPSGRAPGSPQGAVGCAGEAD